MLQKRVSLLLTHPLPNMAANPPTPIPTTPLSPIATRMRTIVTQGECLAQEQAPEKHVLVKSDLEIFRNPWSRRGLGTQLIVKSSCLSRSPFGDLSADSQFVKWLRVKAAFCGPHLTSWCCKRAGTSGIISISLLPSKTVSLVRPLKRKKLNSGLSCHGGGVGRKENVRHNTNFLSAGDVVQLGMHEAQVLTTTTTETWPNGSCL